MDGSKRRPPQGVSPNARLRHYRGGEVVEAITFVVQPEPQRGVLVVPTEAYAGLIREGLQGRNFPIEHLNNAIRNYDVQSTIEHVFVYGTLMKGKERWPRMRSWATEGPFNGHVQGRLYHLGHYPGIRLDEEGLVHGELYRCEDINGALEELDAIEGVDSSTLNLASTFACRSGLKPEQDHVGRGPM